MTVKDEVYKRINGDLHKALDVPACETACTHMVTPYLSILGVAIIIARRAEREAVAEGFHEGRGGSR